VLASALNEYVALSRRPITRQEVADEASRIDLQKDSSATYCSTSTGGRRNNPVQVIPASASTG